MQNADESEREQKEKLVGTKKDVCFNNFSSMSFGNDCFV